MANTIKGKVADAGHAVAEAAKNVGHKIAEGSEKAVDFVKEKTGMKEKPMQKARTQGSLESSEHMKVIASCAKTVGVVDRVEGNAIKLTRKDSPDGQHHFIPVGWIERVDSHVHLTKNSQETERRLEVRRGLMRVWWLTPQMRSHFLNRGPYQLGRASLF